jgi:SAM-dependent methyltransferase
MSRSKSSPHAESKYWDTVADSWNPRSVRGVWRAHSDATNIALLKRWWPRQVTRVLKTDLFDEAVGDGLVPFLMTHASSVHAVDLSAEMAQLAHSPTGGATLTVGDVRRLPFGDGTFDLVVSNSTLDHFEHLEDIGASLGELHRVLAPGGRLIVTFDNLANPVVGIRNALPFPLLHRLGLTPYFVGATCDREGGFRLLTEAGFLVLKEAAVMHCPRILGILAADICDRFAGDRLKRRFLRVAGVFEALERWPTSHQTGYFLGFLAEKPMSSADRVSR